MMIHPDDKILIIAAHPDDEILGCGGLISKYSDTCDFSIIFIAEGDSCRYESTSNLEVVSQIKNRENCAKNALSSLGLTDIEFHRLPCGRLDNIEIIEINKIIESKIKQFRPTKVFTHYGDDTNNDHRIVSRSTQMAVRPIHKNPISVFSYEVLSSTEWNLNAPFNPNFFLKLSEEDLKNKIKALELYDGEIRTFPHSRSSDGINYLSRYRGMQAGFPYAEAFLINKILVES